MKSIEILGINVYPYLNFEDLINDAVSQKKMLLSVNAEILLKSDSELKEIYNNNIGYADGIGAVMALNKKKVKAIKLPGCELWLKIVEKFANTDKTFYIVGSTDKVINKTITQLKEKFPNLKILGYRNGYLNEADIELLEENINKLKPDFVFLAMGMPKQEKLMARLYKIHKAVYLGLGGSFDVFTGNVKRAPQWWIDHKIEFAYRLLKQPLRIKRQLPLVKFYFMVKFGKL